MNRGINWFKVSFIIIFIIAIVYSSLLYLRPSKVLRISFDAEIHPVSPIDTSSFEWDIIKNQIFEGLFEISSSGKLMLSVANDWKSNDTFTEYTISIKDNIKFHDNTKLTLDDVLYSIETVRSGKVIHNSLFMNEVIDTIDTIGTATVVFKLKESMPDFPYFLASNPMKIYKKGVFENDGVPLKQKWVGTGAFRLDEIIKDDKIVLNRFDEYRNSVSIEKIEFIVSKDPELDFKEGKLDVLEIARHKVNEYKSNSGYIVNSHPMLGTFFIGFNLKNKKFRNKNLRKAIYHAIDRAKIVEKVRIPSRNIPKSVVPFGLLGYESDNRSYDIKLAKEYLSKVPKSEMPTKDDMILLVKNPPHSMAVYAAERIKKDLSVIGLPFELKVLNLKKRTTRLNSYFYYLKNNKDFSMYIRGMITSIPSTLHVIRDVFDPNSPLNFGSYNSKKLMQILNDGPKKHEDYFLRSYFEEALGVIYEDMPVIPLGILYTNLVTKRDKPVRMNAISPGFVNLKDAL